MNLLDALKQKDESVRMSCGDRWLYWDDDDELFVVLERPYQAKKNRTLIRTENESEAVAALLRLDNADDSVTGQ